MQSDLKNYILFNSPLSALTEKKLLISTINAHSFNIAKTNLTFRESLKKSDIILPDGIGIILALRFLTGARYKKIAGADLFKFEMKRLNETRGKCFFLGSTEETLSKIQKRAVIEFPKIAIQTFSPPFSDSLDELETNNIIDRIIKFAPDTLFIGMTAPKQEIWAAANFEKIGIVRVCCIGAVFDFYAGNVKRAPKWMINCGLEWFYRLLKEPKRMWKRYLIGNFKFTYTVVKEKFRTRLKNV